MNKNEMNLLENQLRSWQPRRPSPRLSRRIFGASAGNDTGLALRWLTPALACLLLAVTIANQEPSLSRSFYSGQPMMGLISSNLSATNVLPKSHFSDHNGVFPASFEWTNLSDFTSSVSPFSPGRVN